MTDPLSGAHIVDAVELARGSVVDLDRGDVVTPDELRRTSQELERVFRIGGLSPGDRVLMAIGNGPAFIASLVAVLRAEGSPILLHGDSPAAELARAAQGFGAEYVIADSLEVNELQAVGFRGREYSCAAWANGVWARIGPSLGQGGGNALAGVPLHPTSGTTGKPKLAVRPGATAVAEALHYIETIRINEDDTILCTIPMSHAYGFGMCVMVPLLSSATLLTMRRVNPTGLIGALTDRRVTIYPSVPAALDLLLLTAIEELARPRCITTAGAALPERIAKQVNRRWALTVRPLYGTTETGGITVATPDHDVAATSSVGPPMNGVEVRLEPLDGSQLVTEGLGELWVRSSSMMAGYVSSSGIDRSPIEGGWFNTGDVASLDEEGNILLHGRASETINVFGNKVLPREVEEVILLLPQVLEVKVYAAPNRWGSNWVKAAVVATRGLTAADVQAHCTEHLVPYKRPEQIEMLDQIPRSPAGKVIVSQLP